MADKNLNSLDRFRKQSTRLVLEEHGHCEVPAGCGGVVLRWRNPLAALPLIVNLYAPVTAALFVDGRAVENRGLDLEPGSHVFAFVLESIDLGGGLFMFTAIHDPKRAAKHLPPGLREQALQILSATDATWRVLTEEPIEHGVAWTAVGFDDSSWGTLARSVAAPTVNWEQFGAQQAYACNERKAAFLALPKGTKGKGHVWVRRSFVIPAPQST